MTTPQVLINAWLPDGQLERLRAEFPGVEFTDGRDPVGLDRHLATADIAYGLVPVDRLDEAKALRWLQLISAGVPQNLGAPAQARSLTVTNLAGLYGPTIAEHALGMAVLLARNLHVVLRNQAARRWDRDVAHTMADLRGKTLTVVGLGNIGSHIGRLARAYGMRVLGCRRTGRPSPDADRVGPPAELRELLAEADVVAVAAPLTPHTTGILGPAEFAAMKPCVLYINVSRGPVAQEGALLDALRSGRVSAAGLDVFATEPLPPEHPLWEMPQVIVSPHYCGETVNNSRQPAERFARNLHAWLGQGQLEGVVDLEWGY